MHDFVKKKMFVRLHSLGGVLIVDHQLTCLTILNKKSPCPIFNLVQAAKVENSIFRDHII